MTGAILEAFLAAIDDEQSELEARITFERMKEIATRLCAEFDGEELHE
jgi:hypothetical protein